MAFLLYLPVAALIVFAWSRRIAPISRAAALALLLLPLVFTGRAMLTNRVYAPIDLPFQFEPLKAHAAAFGVERPHDPRLSDLHAQMIPWQKAVRYALAHGEWPLWNPFILCGDILAAAAQPAVYDPVNWIALLLPLPHALTFGAAMTFFFAAFFTFVFARSIGLREGPALVAAAAFAFCAMLAFYVGWPLGRAWTLLPLVLFSVRERRWAMLAMALTLLIVAGHPETVLHVVTIGVIYGLRPKGLRQWRWLGGALLAGLVALGLTAVYLLPFLEAAPQTFEHHFRSERYAQKPYGETITPAQRNERIARSVLPWVKGDPLSTRVGFSVLLLALFARRKEAWFFVALAVAGFLVACGIPPLPHLLHELPLYDIAINERFAFAGSFALAMLAGMGADRWPRLAPLLLAIVLIERTLEDGGIYPAIEQRAFYPSVVSIPKSDELFRVAGAGLTLLPNGSALYELEDVRGYQAMTFHRLAQTYPIWSRYQVAYFNIIDDPSRPFLNFLNVKYILNGGEVIENPNVLPRVFVPRRVRFELADNVVHQMSLATDFADAAWIESDQPHERVNASGNVSIKRKGLAYELGAKMDADGWIVVSESAWKGWRAYIDGRRVETHFANHAFLGLFVPKGEHAIRLVYLPESFTRGRAISLLTIALLVAGKIIRACRRSRSISSSPSPSS
jgi:Bacterial membrane protein YfhO